MKTLVQTQQKKTNKHSLSTAQKTFNRLKNKIEKFQQELEAAQTYLNQALDFFHKELLPRQRTSNKALEDCIKLMYGHYKNLSCLTKKERELLKELICCKINEAFDGEIFNDFDPELCAIFKELEGMDYKQIISDEFSNMKEYLEDMFKEHGLDIDLSKINVDDDFHDTMQKVRDLIDDVAAKAQKEREPETRKKTKRELEKERRAQEKASKVQELENLQKKGLASIYKQLAKALHPDLEQDPFQKAEKEMLMKKLTNAYENDDLHTLLTLEIEWMNRVGNEENSTRLSSDAQLKIYNSILKDQIEDLQNRFETLLCHPQYMPIRHYCTDEMIPPTFAMQLEVLEVEEHIKALQANVQELRGNRPEKLLRRVLSHFHEELPF